MVNSKPGCQVAIVGAGPYGLAAAAFLQAAGVEVRLFGRTMEFWEHHMPEGMYLRSLWEGSSIGNPQQALTLDRYQAVRGQPLSRPIPLADFVSYGKWYQSQALPDPDQRRVTGVTLAPGGFYLTLEDGEIFQARRVVVATGVAGFTRIPAVLQNLPVELVSHSYNSVNHELKRFAGQQVAIIGGGQSALEAAALMREAGVEVEVITRAPQVRWLRHGSRLHSWLHSQANPVRPVLYPPGDVGPPGLNWLVETPDLFRQLPRAWQDRIAQRCIRPACTGWVRPRITGARLTSGRQVMSATPTNAGQLQLTLDDGSVREFDQVYLATGYNLQVTAYNFLNPEIKKAIRQVQGYPVLSDGFESSVPRLHFIGASAAYSFGPLCRFVAGTGYMGRTIARVIQEKERLNLRGSELRQPEPFQSMT
jgi:cation diffusion facilitator CzcD-associated flavoprotein CzcO